MKYLIVGLGNIGPEYRDTRHNIGFMVLDALARANNLSFTDGRYGFTTTLSVKGRQMILLKPSTFMNLSGNAVRYWMQKEKIALEDLLVIVDDLALPFGKMRLRAQGSDGGHNGLKNINALFVNINLHPTLIKKSVLANILLAPNVTSLHFFITIMTITQIIAVPIRNASIHFFKLNLP